MEYFVNIFKNKDGLFSEGAVLKSYIEARDDAIDFNGSNSMTYHETICRDEEGVKVMDFSYAIRMHEVEVPQYAEQRATYFQLQMGA